MKFPTPLSPLCFPVLCSVILACDATGPGALHAEGADTDVSLDDFDTEYGSSGDSSGEFDDDEWANEEFQSEVVPSAAQWAGWVGGNGGSQSSGRCPGDHSVIGVAASSTGSFVRQLAVVCAPNWEIENADTIEPEEQFVIASGYYNNSFPAGLVAPNWGWRPAWDASAILPGSNRLKAPGTVYRLCNTGYKVSKVDVRAGGYVDRIDSITCEWAGPGGPPGGVVIYPRSVNVGGWGGTRRSSSCQGLRDFPDRSREYADGAGFRSAYWLDGFRLWCD